MKIITNRCNPFQKYQFLLPLMTLISLLLGRVLDGTFGELIGGLAALTLFYVAPVFIVMNILAGIYLFIKKGEWRKQILITFLLLLSFVSCIIPLINFMVQKSGM